VARVRARALNPYNGVDSVLNVDKKYQGYGIYFEHSISLWLTSGEIQLKDIGNTLGTH